MAFADLMLAIVAEYISIYFVGAVYQFWTTGFEWISLYIFSMIANPFFTSASLISAAFISAEKLYATYWPLKHQTLLTRAYRLVIVMIWTLALVFAAIGTALNLFISAKHSTYFWTLYILILIFIICGCNIAIRKKFQQGGVVTQ